MPKIDRVYVWQGCYGPSVGMFREGRDRFFLGVTKSSLQRLVRVMGGLDWRVVPALCGQVGWHGEKLYPGGSLDA